MDELDSLLNDLGKDLDTKGTRPKSQKVDFDSLDSLVASVESKSPAHSRKSRMVKKKGHLRPKAPAKSSGSGIQDLDSLMEELGAIEPQKATLVSSNGNQAATKPTASTLVGDLDNLMAGLDASLGDSPQTQPPLPQSKRPVGHAPPPSRQGTHIGSQPQKKQDLDSLINNLQTDTTTITARPTDTLNTTTTIPDQDGTTLYHKSHSETAKGLCASCQKPIHQQMLQALGGTYHPSCFACGNCGASLGNATFYNLDGLPNCARCYQALFCARCAHCDKAIQGSCMNALGKKWHVNCFICSQCLKPFGTSTFHERDGNPFCQACFYGIFSSRCAGCDQPIEGDTVNACGKQWHPEHFACSTCKKVFGAQPYFEHNGLPYCKLHFHQKQGSNCGCGCGRPVMGRCVSALGKQWLPEHFVCGFCMNPLAGVKFTEKDGKAYCGVCYDKFYGS